MDKVVSAWGIKIPLWNDFALIHFSMLCAKYIECLVHQFVWAQVLNIVENSSERNCSLIFTNDKTWALSSEYYQNFWNPCTQKKSYFSVPVL
jgi:hypothetical protein